MTATENEILTAIKQLRVDIRETNDRENSSKIVSEDNAKNIEKILLLLNGNGHPEDGMMFKLTQVYDWMERHTREHIEEKQRQEAKADKEVTRAEKRQEQTRDFISGIIKWLLPFLVFGVAEWIVENVHV